MLTVLISTYNDRVKQLDTVLNSPCDKIQYTIIHQVDNGEEYSLWVDKLKHERTDVRYVLSKTTGVAKSRNIAISLVDTKYAIFMDDDVKLASNFYNIVISSFEKHPNATVLTFRCGDIDTGEPLKDYLLESNKHTKFSILKVGTIEIAFDVYAVKHSGVQFPEYLGAGTSLPACDEPVFLARLMSKGHSLVFIPKTVVYHPRLSSGKEFINENAFVCRGVAFKEIFGQLLSIPIIILFYLKNRQKFQLQNKSSFLALFKGYVMTKFDEPF